MSQTSKISVSLPIDLTIKLDITREKMRISRSAFVRMALENLFQKLETQKSEEKGNELEFDF